DDVASTGYMYVYDYSTGAPQSTPNFMRMYRTNSTTNASEELVLISPSTDNLGNGTKQLRFSVRSYSTTTYDNKLEILSMPDPTTTTGATVIATIYPNQKTYQEYIVPLPATTDDYFGFSLVNPGSTTASSVAIDDVYYEDLLPCIFPMNIQVTNITATGVDISWDSSVASGVTGYYYEVRDEIGRAHV